MKKLFAYMDVFFRKFQLPKGCEYVGQNAYFGAFQPFPRLHVELNVGFEDFSTPDRLRVESYVGFEDFQPRIGCV